MKKDAMNKKDLEQLTMKALRALAQELGLKGISQLSKGDLVNGLLRQSRKPAAPAPGAQKQSAKPVLVPETPASSMPSSAPVSKPAPNYPQLQWLGTFPDRYGETAAVLLPQKPGYLYAYWEVTQHDLDRGRRELGDPPAGLVLRVRELGGGVSFDIEVHSMVGDWFFPVGWLEVPIQVELGLKTPDNRFYLLATSNRIVLPRVTPSKRVDPEWSVLDAEFESMYALSGGAEYAPGSELAQRQGRGGWLSSSSRYERGS